MRAGVGGQRVRHRAAAGAAADDDDVEASVCIAVQLTRVAARRRIGPCRRAGVDLVHQPLIVDRALEAHLGRAARRGSRATKSRYIAW